MATQTTTEPAQTLITEEGKSSVRKAEVLQTMCLTHSGSEDQHSHIKHQEEEMEVVEEEGEVEEEDPQEQQETQMIKTMAQS